MKTAIRILIVIILMTIICWLVLTKPPDGMILVSKAWLDSLSNIKEDTITRIDTIWAKPDTVIVVKRIPSPTYSNDSLKLAYHDSLVNADLSVHVFDTVSSKGILLFRRWEYNLRVPRLISKEVTILKPFPTPYPVHSMPYTYYGGVGYNFIEGGLTGEIGLVRGRFMLGVQAGEKFGAIRVAVLF